MNYNDVLDFWLKLELKQFWQKDKDFDNLIAQKFGDVHNAAMAGELSAWRNSNKGRLAEIIVLDQFSRNIYRDTPKAFSSDIVALVLAQEAISLTIDEKFSPLEKLFLYLPFMHSESKIIHEQAVILFAQEGLEDNLAFEYRHKKIIDQFGRYPHRNKILGRVSTAAEEEFLTQDGSSF